MRYRKNLSHTTKNSSEKRTYLDDVLGSTASLPESSEGIDETLARGTPGKSERIYAPTGDDGRLPPYRSFRSKIVDWFDDNLFGVVVSALGLIFAILGYFYIELSNLGRESGIAGTKADYGQVQIADVSDRMSKLEDKQSAMAASMAALQETISIVKKRLGL